VVMVIVMVVVVVVVVVVAVVVVVVQDFFVFITRHDYHSIELCLWSILLRGNVLHWIELYQLQNISNEISED